VARRGSTGGKKVKGRKRFIGVDSLGLVWALLVTTADVQDRDGGCWLLGAVRHRLARVREVIADSGFSRRFQEFVRGVCRWAVSITTKAAQGFVVQPRRWVVERTFAWFVRYRRLTVDYEYLPETSEAMILAAMTHLMLRRLHPTK
jgi:putative transposase